MANDEIKVRISGDAAQLASELAKAKASIQSAGTAMERAMGKVKDSFTSTLTSINRFGAMAAVAAATGVAMLVKKSIDSADELSKMAQKVGVSTESLSTLKFAADLADVSLESLGIGLKKLSKNVAGAADGSGDAKNAFKALGVEVKNSDGQLKKSDALLLELATKFKDLPDGAEKTALAIKLFGRSGADLIPLLNSGASGIKELQDRARALGLELSTEAGLSAEEFNDRLTELKATGEGFVRTIAVDMLPWLNEYVKTVHLAYKESGLLKAAWVALGGIGEGTKDLLFGKSLALDIKEAQNELANLKKLAAQGPAGFGFSKGYKDEIAETQTRLDGLLKKQQAIRDQEDADRKKRREDEEKDAALKEKNAAALRKRMEAQAQTDANNKLAEKTIQDMQKELALNDSMTRVEKIRWEMSEGQYKDLSKSQKTKILGLATELDILDQLTKMEKEEKALTEAIDKQNEALALEAETFGLTAIDAALYKMQIQGATLEQLAFAKAMLESADAQKTVKDLFEETRTPLEKFEKEQKRLNDLLEKGTIDINLYGRGMAKAQDELDKATDKPKDEFKELKESIEGWGKDSADAIVKFARTGESSFSDMIDAMINDLLRMMVYQNITKPLFGMISGGLSSGASSLSGWGESLNLGSLFGMNAKGNAFSHGKVIPFANGGIVTRPTVFPMAQGMGLMGEAGPEAIVPLKRMADGKLGVISEGRGGSLTIGPFSFTFDGERNKRLASEMRTEMEETALRVIRRHS